MARVVISRNLQALIQPQLLPAIDQVTEELAADARSYARARAWGPGGKYGHYADQMEARSGLVRGRARGWIVAMKYTARFLEGGTKNRDGSERMPARHILENFGRTSGLRYRRGRTR